MDTTVSSLVPDLEAAAARAVRMSAEDVRAPGPLEVPQGEDPPDRAILRSIQHEGQ